MQSILGNVTVRVPSANLNDNVWHKVVVERRGKSVKVTVDDLSQGKRDTCTLGKGCWSLQRGKGGKACSNEANIVRHCWANNVAQCWTKILSKFKLKPQYRE